jgi:hypothetical protein
MEKSVFITKINQLKYVNNKYTRVYFGNEFCERLIPSLGQLKQVLAYIRRKKLNFSLVTPYVTNYGLGKIKALLKFLIGEGISCEIIINDWGVLNLINYQSFNLTPVLGRLLIKQRRGPKLAKLLEKKVKKTWLFKDPRNPKKKTLVFQMELPQDLESYYKGSNISSVPIIHNFLISRGVKRIELDNTVQGLFLELPKDKISASVYFPYTYIATTFFCPTANCDHKEKIQLKIKSCRRQCQRYVFKLRHKTMPKVIYLKGNTQFYKNPRLSIEKMHNLGIDRIVYEPEIPV